MQKKSRRNFLKTGTTLLVGTAFITNNSFKSFSQENPKLITLPPLPYDYNALEPYIDELTMNIHHTKHHQGYINNLNKALEKLKDNTLFPLEDFLKHIDKLPEELKTSIRNNGGGHWNHTFFWKVLTPSANCQKSIEKYFTTIDSFKENFSKTAMSVFGSGWTWLIVTSTKELKIVSTPNQDNPLMDVSAENGTPILGIDLWEHAYYLKNQNRRSDYLKNFWQVVNWNFVNDEFEKAM
jgi:superoxide dismutase, Fe-Mn family